MIDPDQNSNGDSLAQLLKGWDGVDLIEGVKLAAKARGVKTLRQWLELTTEVESYQHHIHRQGTKK